MPLTATEQRELNELDSIAFGFDASKLSDDELAELLDLERLGVGTGVPRPSEPGAIAQFFDPGLQEGVGVPAEPFLQDPLAAIAGTARGVGERLVAGGKQAVEFLPEAAATAATLHPAGRAAAITERATAGFLPKLLQFGRSLQRPTAAATTAAFPAGVIREAVRDPSAGIVELGEAGARSGVEMGAAEVAGQALGPVIQAGFGVSKRAAIDPLIQWARGQKIPIQPSALATTGPQRFVANVLRGGADLFLPSRLTLQFQRSKLARRMNDIIRKTPDEFGGAPGIDNVRLATQQELTRIISRLDADAKRLAETFLEDIGPKTLIPLTRYKALLRTVKSQAKDDNLLDFVNKDLEKIGKRVSINAESLEASLRQLAAELGRVKGKDKNFIGQIRNAIKQDFTAGGANKQLLEESDEFFIRSGALLKSGKRGLVGKLKTGDIPSDQVTRQIFLSGNEKMLEQLERNMAPEVWDALRAQNLADRLEQFSRPLTSLPGTRYIAQTDNFIKYVNANESMLNSVYGPQTTQALKNFARFAERALPDIGKLEKGIEGTTAAIIGTGAVAGKTAFTDPAALFELPVVFGIGMTVAMARSLMAPRGLLKTWLTTGFPQTAIVAEQTAKLGLRFAADQSELELPSF